MKTYTMLTNEQLEFFKDLFCNFVTTYILMINGIQPNNLEINNKSQVNEDTDSKFLSKQQVIETYYPLFTEYGLTQAIHTGQIPYIKRGKKYFFSKQEIDKWISNSSKDTSTPRIKYV